MTPAKLHSALDLLAEVRRLLGASTLHVQVFDVNQDVIATIMVEGGIVSQKPSWTTVELERPGVLLDAFAAAPARPGVS